MTTGHDARANSFRDPRWHDEVTNLGFNAQKISRAHFQALRMRWMNPKRIRMRNLVEPLCVCTARVNLHSEPERRDQDRLTFFEVVFVNVTLEVRGD